MVMFHKCFSKLPRTSLLVVFLKNTQWFGLSFKCPANTSPQGKGMIGQFGRWKEEICGCFELEFKSNFNAKCCTKRQFLEEARVREEGGMLYVSMNITDNLNKSHFICLMFSGCLIQLSTSHLEYKGAAILNISARI